jgi:hypothetical protein
MLQLHASNNQAARARADCMQVATIMRLQVGTAADAGAVEAVLPAWL